MSRQLFVKAFDDGRLLHFALTHFFCERGRLVDFAANDVARDDHDETQQERNAPAPREECVFGHVVREGQEHRRSQDLAGLHALQAETGEEATATEGRVLQDHRAGAGDFTRHREALDQTQQDEQRGGQQADLLVRRQQSDGDGRETHEEHANEQHMLSTPGVAPVAEHEGADGPRDIADAVGRQRGDDRDPRIARWKEYLREDERRRGRVDEEVVVLQRRADPAAGSGLLRLVSALRLVVLGVAHLSLRWMGRVDLGNTVPCRLRRRQRSTIAQFGKARPECRCRSANRTAKLGCFERLTICMDR